MRPTRVNTATLLVAVVVLLLLNLAVLVHHQADELVVVSTDATTSTATTTVSSSAAGWTGNSRLRHTRSEFVVASSSSSSSFQQQQQRQPDGMLNSQYPLYRLNDTSLFHSNVHCVGEGFEIEHAWIHRSCHYQNLCLDLSTHEYVLFATSPHQHALQQAFPKQQQQPKQDNAVDPASWSYLHIPSLVLPLDHQDRHNLTHVSMGGINTKWTWSHGVPRLEWAPTVLRQAPPPNSVLVLDPTVVWMPFHSMAAFNPGHLVWDDYLPIYTLLSMFQLLPRPKDVPVMRTNHNSNDDDQQEDDYQLLLTRYILPGERLWASCETRETNREQCNKMFRKFLPLMGIRNFTHFSTNRDVRVELYKDQQHTSDNGHTRYVCAKNGVAGLGMLTDHGLKQHGWTKGDFEYLHNHGRGGVLFDFRQYLMANLGVSHFASRVNPTPPYQITFSVKSSSNLNRNIDFSKQIQAIQQAFPKDQVLVQTVELKELSLVEQVRVASESAIFISACGGGAVTATFLPRGASVFLYFVHNGSSRASSGPARLDWDLFNNAAYLRTTWLPKHGMDAPSRLELLLQLIRHELDIISHS